MHDPCRFISTKLFEEGVLDDNSHPSSGRGATGPPRRSPWEVRVGPAGTFRDMSLNMISKRIGAGGQPEGVAIWSPKGMPTILKKVYVPFDPDLAGRGLMMYFERGLFSYVFATIYNPINTFGPKNTLTNKKIWQQVLIR